MNFIDLAFIRLQSSVLLNIDIGKDTDPLAYLESESTELKDPYARQFFQALYGIVATVFWAGSLITLLICLGKYMIAGKGNERKEHQLSVVFKCFLMSTFVALPGFISFLMEQF